MLRLSYIQFKHSWKTWFSSLILFIFSGLVIGTCLNGIFTISSYYPNIPSNKDPRFIFYFPLIFGLLTLFIVSNGIIKLIINSMSKEYSLWTIIGANPNQLSLMIGNQFGFLSFLGSFIGFLISIPSTTILYSWVTRMLDMNDYIKMPLNFSIKGFIYTVLLLFITSFCSGYFHSNRLFVSSKNNLLSFNKSVSKLKRFMHYFSILIVSIFLIIFIINSSYLNSQANKYFLDNNFHEAAKSYINDLLLIMFLYIICMNLLSKIILPNLIKLFRFILPVNHLGTFNIAYHNSLFDKEFLSSLIIPLCSGSFLLTGITYITSNITNGGGSSYAAINSEVSIVDFLGGPLIIILANVLTISIFFIKKQLPLLQKLFLLGFNMREMIFEKIIETFIYSILFFSFSVISNLIIYIIVYRIEFITNNIMSTSIFSVFFYPLILVIIVFTFLLIINIMFIINSYKKNNSYL